METTFTSWLAVGGWDALSVLLLQSRRRWLLCSFRRLGHGSCFMQEKLGAAVEGRGGELSFRFAPRQPPAGLLCFGLVGAPAGSLLLA